MCEKWISVEDRLPNKDGDYVLILNSEEQISTCLYCEEWGFYGKTSNDMLDYGAEVLYWMPLPDLPEEMKKGE